MQNMQDCLTPRTRNQLKIRLSSHLKLSHRLTMLEKRIRPSLRHQRWLRPPLRVPDMLTVMQRTLRTGGPNYEDILRELDDYMRPGNHVFPSD